MEGKEGVLISAEEWVEIPQDLQDMLNTDLRNEGVSSAASSGEGVVLSDTDINRRDKVLSAMDLAMGKIFAEKIRAGKSNGLSILTSSFEYDGRFVVSFCRNTNVNDDLYNKERTEILNQTNKILTTFDQTPLPNYTSTNRRSLE